MRHLIQPRVLNLAIIAGLASALACYPRVSLWLNRPGPVWYLEAMVFLCATMLWGFVFAWHTQYTNRPVFVLKPAPRPFLAVTLIGLFIATAFHLWLDPPLRAIMPLEYPVDREHWLAVVLFALALNQLFLLFAPFAWLMRFFKNRWVATTLTALFGAGVVALKIHSLPTPVPPPLLTLLLAFRIGMGFLTVEFYLRGGVLLVWLWTLLFESRHLFELTGNF